MISIINNEIISYVFRITDLIFKRIETIDKWRLCRMTLVIRKLQHGR